MRDVPPPVRGVRHSENGATVRQLALVTDTGSSAARGAKVADEGEPSGPVRPLGAGASVRARELTLESTRSRPCLAIRRGWTEPNDGPTGEAA